VWLANRGLFYRGVDVSPVAIDLARRLASELKLADRCHFSVHDLDDGLPEGPQVELLFCYKFRDPRLDPMIVERLAPGGIVAIAVLSEVGAAKGPFRASPGELTTAFSDLETVVAGEADGLGWFIGRKNS
jgi:SAM-dependent methyltransferase